MLQCTKKEKKENKKSFSVLPASCKAVCEKGDIKNVLVRDLSDLWFSLKDDNSPTLITRGQELSGLAELHRRDHIRWITDKNYK